MKFIKEQQKGYNKCQEMIFLNWVIRDDNSWGGNIGTETRTK
jgi:hypothetical protein